MERGAISPTYTLRRVASIALSLASIIPLLLFVYTVLDLGMIHRTIAQVTLALALGSTAVGTYIFWVMLARLSNMLRAATAAAEAAPSPDGEAEPGEPEQTHFEIPGMGQVGEVHAFLTPLEDLGAVWRAEAEPHIGRCVLVSVMNAVEPIDGVLTQVAHDGLLLDRNGQRVGITYRRISAIELDPAAPVAAGG